MRSVTPLKNVLLDVAGAYVLAIVLMLGGLLVRTHWLDSGVSAAVDPFAEVVSAELTVDADAPEALWAADIVRTSGATEEQMVASLHADDDGTAWLVVRARRGHDPLVAVRAAGEAGVFAGRVHVERAALDPAALADAEPDAVFASLGWLLPWMLFCTGTAFLVGGLVARRRRPAELGAPVGGVPRRVGIGVAIGVAALIVTALVTALMSVVGVPPIEQEWIVRLSRGGAASFAVLLIAVGVLAPLGEELLFRGHVFRWLRVHSSRGLAYGVSAVLFAFVHLNPSALPQYVAYALLFAWAYERWRSLVVPMVAHTVVNVTAVFLLRAGVV